MKRGKMSEPDMVLCKHEQLRPIYTWQDGCVVLSKDLHPGCIVFCPECNYKVRLETTTPGAEGDVGYFWIGEDKWGGGFLGRLIRALIRAGFIGESITPQWRPKTGWDKEKELSTNERLRRYSAGRS